MVLYESHSVIHGKHLIRLTRPCSSENHNNLLTVQLLYRDETGRPFPLHGRFYANVFLHFEPYGHTERHNEKQAHDATTRQTAKERYEKSLTSPSPPSLKYDLPAYIKAGSEEEVKWRQQYIFQAVEPVRFAVYLP